MDATAHRGPAAFDALTPEWVALVAEDPAAGIFHRPEFLRVWWEELGGGAEPYAVAVREGAALRGLATLAAGPDGTLRFLGDPEVIDYLGPISAPADRDAVAAAVVGAVGGLDGWRRAELAGLAADSGWPEALARAGKAAGLEVAEEPLDACPRVALGGSYEEYLAALPGKLRHEIRRKARRLERELGPFTVRTADGASLEEDLERFFAMHRSSNGPKGKFLDESRASFFARLARTLTAAGWLRLCLLEAGGAAIAGVFAFSDGVTWSVYNSAYDHRHRAVAPGMVLVAETIAAAAAEGCRTFDLLRGTEEYKYRLGAVDVPVVALTMRRP